MKSLSGNMRSLACARSAKIPYLVLDTLPQTCYNTRMENDRLEIEGDLRDEYLANQEAELGQEPEIATDAEIKVLMRELWEEFVPPPKEEEYTEEDVFRDFYMDQKESFDG